MVSCLKSIYNLTSFKSHASEEIADCNVAVYPLILRQLSLSSELASLIRIDFHSIGKKQKNYNNLVIIQ